MTFYVNLLGAKTSVIGVDTKGKGQMQYVCAEFQLQSLMEGERSGEISVDGMIM